MSDRVPSYTWIDPPLFASQLVAETWTFRLEEETSPGSKRFLPVDLTGLTATLSLQREDPLGSGVFVSEILDAALTIAAPTTGVVSYARSAALVLPDGDHLGEIALYQGATCVARAPGGRRYFRVVVGRKLGT